MCCAPVCAPVSRAGGRTFGRAPPADDPQLARHVADAIARHSRRGWRIDKPSARTHIDAMIALCMAVERAEYQPEPVELLGWL